MPDEELETTGPKGPHGQHGHVSVLLKEAIDFSAVRRDGTYIDATVGAGGHSSELARRLGAQGRLIGFDKDPRALEIARKRMSAEQADWPQIDLRQGSFRQIAELPEKSADGILADLGLSSLQLSDAQRGFSFQAEGPLDMRMDPREERTADQAVNRMDEEELANLIYEFGEERRSRRIARAIVRARPVRTTAHLAQVISAAARPMKFGKGIHPATLTFQALRIFVNRELDDLDALLKMAPKVLAKGGRLVVISFHSLEDRRVKDSLREGAKHERYEIL